MKLTFASKYAHTMPGLRVKGQKIRFLKNKQKRRRCTNHHHVVCFYMPSEVLTRWKNRPPPSSVCGMWYLMYVQVVNPDLF